MIYIKHNHLILKWFTVESLSMSGSAPFVFNIPHWAGKTNWVSEVNACEFLHIISNSAEEEILSQKLINKPGRHDSSLMYDK